MLTALFWLGRCVCVCVCVCVYVCVCGVCLFLFDLVRFTKFSRPSQCSTTGVTKTAVCAILSVGWCIQKNPYF